MCLPAARREPSRNNIAILLAVLDARIEGSAWLDHSIRGIHVRNRESISKKQE